METASGNSKSRMTFSVRRLLAWTMYVAIPLAFFRVYVTRVTNTVDGTTVPLRNASGIAILFLLLGLLSLAVIFLTMLWKRQYISAIAAVLIASIVSIFGYPALDRHLLHPKQGNSIAHRNNDAAMIAATACRAFYVRTNTWPRSWADLESELNIATKALSFSRMQQVNAFSQMQQVNADPNYLAAPLKPEDIRDCVEIDFSADPEILATQSWTHFTGIVPRRPCYNLYREPFAELIAALSSSQQNSK